MVRFYGEPVTALDVRGERCQRLVRQLHDITASTAHEVNVALVGKVVHGRSVAHVDVLKDAERLQCIQGTVDRRDRDFRVQTLDPRGDLVRREVLMTVPFEQHRHNRPSRCSDPPPICAKSRQYLVDFIRRG